MDVGLHTIFRSQDGTPEVDVVAVHGLNFKNKPNHGIETWTLGHILWLRDFLPQALAKPCRVMLFEYNSSPALGASAINLDSHASNLLHWINLKRKVSPLRPLIFICHSLGGLIAKQVTLGNPAYVLSLTYEQALVQAKLDDTLKSIVDATRLLVFFATPHQGGSYASVGDIAAKMLRTTTLRPSNDLLDALKRSSNEATRRAEQSRHIYERCLVVSFYEGQPYGKAGIVISNMLHTGVSLTAVYIVDQRSATLNLPGSREKQIPMDSDHSSICKFDSADTAMCKLALGTISMEFQRALKFGTLNSLWLVPGSVNSLFTGRSEIVKRIKNALLPEIAASEQKRFVLTGMAGQGKSEVCLKVVNELRELFWGIFWVDVSNESTAAAGFNKIADILGLGASNIDHTCLMLANCSPDKNWLLVLDNADDPDTDYQLYIPSGSRGAVLLTSRVSDCCVHATVGSEELHNLSEQECITLLLNGSGIQEQARSEYIAAARVIVEILGSHTLALLQAAAYIASGHCSLSEYPSHFQQQRKRLLEHSSKQARSRYGNIYATFEAAAQVLRPFEAESPPDSLILLELLSAFHYENVPLYIFETAWIGAEAARENPPNDENIGHLSLWHINKLPVFLRSNSIWDPFRLSSAISQLESLALIKRSHISGHSSLTMHPLTHSWITARIHRDPIRTSSYLKMSACIIALSNWDGEQRTFSHQFLGPHLDILLRKKDCILSTENPSMPLLQIYTELAWMLFRMQDYQRGESLLHWIFQHLNATYEKASEKSLRLYILASFYLELNGEIKKALSLSEEIFRIREDTLNVNDLDRIAVQHNFADLLLKDGQTKKAIELLEHVVKIHESALDPKHPDRLASNQVLGGAFLVDGQTKKSINLLQQVVAIQETTLDANHPRRLTSEQVLGRAFLADGQTNKAIELLQRVVDMQEVTLDPGHPNRLDSEYDLGRAFLADGQTKKALNLFEHIVATRETILDPKHLHRLASEHELGRALLADGQTKRAVELLEHVVVMFETELDPEHPNRITSQYWLAQANAQCSEETNAAASPVQEPESSSRPSSKRFGKLVQRFRRH